MNIGKNNYQYPGADGIHIIVGIQNSDGSFDPVSLGTRVEAMKTSLTHT